MPQNPLKLTLICFFLSTLLPSTTLTQDMHWSQFFMTPLWTNPALTGAFQGTWRIGANFRQQWKAIPIPYNTLSTWADIIIHPAKNKTTLAKPSPYLSLGALFLYDKAGQAPLQTTKTYLFLSAHVPLNNQHILSIGFAPGFVSRALNWTNLTFDQQWTGTSFDNNLPSGELQRQSSLSYLDLGTGITWSAQLTDELRTWLGLSAYHLNQPRETFIQNNNQIAPHWTTLLGAEGKLSPRVALGGSTMFSTQRKARELLAELHLIYIASPQHNLALIPGIIYRWQDAITPTFRIHYQQLTISIAYDLNISTLKTATTYRGGTEIGIIYTGKLPQRIYKQSLPCPRL